MAKTRGSSAKNTKKRKVENQFETKVNTVEGIVEPQAVEEVANEPVEQEQVEVKETPVEENPILKKEDDIEVRYNVSDEDTREMMNFTRLTTIPRFPQNAIWVRAIAKVLKIDTSVSWVVLRRTGVHSHNIEKIFGHCSAIKKVGTPIPIEIVDYNFAATFPKTPNEMAKFIVDYTKDEKWYNASVEELGDKIIDIQIEMFFNEYEENVTKRK